MRITRRVVTFLAAFGITSAGFAAALPITGTWLTNRDRGIVRIARCGSEVCATITGRGPAYPKDGPPALDVKNGDTALRARPLVGLVVMTNAHLEGNHWQGNIYSPDDGRAYPATFAIQPNGTLKVRGCWFFVCLTQSWTPVRPDDTPWLQTAR